MIATLGLLKVDHRVHGIGMSCKVIVFHLASILMLLLNGYKIGC